MIGFTGGFSLIECSINHSYYEQHGFYVLNAGIAPECWSTPNSSPVNMGPRYSSDGATQYVIGQKVDKIAFDQSNVPGTGYIAARAEAGRRRGQGRRSPSRPRTCRSRTPTRWR